MGGTFPVDDPAEMARILREQAEETHDPAIARFLRELVQDYEELAARPTASAPKAAAVPKSDTPKSE